MAEYIDKSEIRWRPKPRSEREYQTFNLDDAYDQGYDDAFDQVEAIKPADVRENVRGEWLYVVETIDESTFYGHRCSKCNYWKAMGTMNFCPNCGACMKETNND